MEEEAWCLVYILAVASGWHCWRSVSAPPPARAAELSRVYRPAAAAASMRVWWRRVREGMAHDVGQNESAGRLSPTKSN